MSLFETSKRSDSSLFIRRNLKTNQVKVPEVNAQIDIRKYLELADSFYHDGIKAFHAGNLTRAYIELQKFNELAINGLKNHPSFATDPQVKKWIFATQKSSIEYLEKIAYKMDEDQDHRAHSLLHEEFDRIDLSKGSIFQPAPSKFQEHKIYEDHSAKEETKSQNNKSKWDILRIPSFHRETSRSNNNNRCEFVTRPKELRQDHSPVRHLSNVQINITNNQLNEDMILGISSLPKEDLDILRCLSDYHRFNIPQPNTTEIYVQLTPDKFIQFYKDDFYVSFAGFLQNIPSELQISRSAIETNRCFYVHLGIALGIHPYVLQAAFRVFATPMLKSDVWYADLLQTVMTYAGFVDANALYYLWPKEFSKYRICFISGSLTKPIFTCFTPVSSNDPDSFEELTEIILYCNGSHFTLLRPSLSHFQVISQMLSEARKANLPVHDNEIILDASSACHSIDQFMKQVQLMR